MTLVSIVYTYRERERWTETQEDSMNNEKVFRRENASSCLYREVLLPCSEIFIYVCSLLSCHRYSQYRQDEYIKKKQKDNNNDDESRKSDFSKYSYI